MESTLVRLGIPGIALGLAALFVFGVTRAERALSTPEPLLRQRVLKAGLGVALFLAFIAVLALSGALARFDVKPPPMLLWFACVLGTATWVGLSSFGKRLALGLPVAALIGFQAFRLPLELVMHQAAADGLMPEVMTFTGYNFDILSGISAALLAPLVVLGKAPRRLIVAFNALASALLFAIATIAMLASPVIRAFGAGQLNVWVTRFPYCWMAVMVAAALLGHILLARRLLAERAQPARAAAAGGAALV